MESIQTTDYCLEKVLSDMLYLQFVFTDKTELRASSVLVRGKKTFTVEESYMSDTYQVQGERAYIQTHH